jgi:hypothetical protein
MYINFDLYPYKRKENFEVSILKKVGCALAAGSSPAHTRSL